MITTTAAGAPSRARHRREQVLDAAAACFRSKGFHAASIAGISQAAGMSPGHIYHYFDNKEAIVTAIVEREESELVALIEATRASMQRHDLVDAILERLEIAIVRLADIERARLTLEILTEAARNPEIARVVQRSSRMLREKFLRLLSGLAEDMPLPDPPDAELIAKVELLGALLEGLTVRRVRDPQLDLEIVGRHMRRVVRQMLGD